MVAITNRAVINKMMAELQKAKKFHEKEEVMKRHVSHVQLLCDLLLQETDTSNSKAISQEEMKAMIGNQSRQSSEYKTVQKQSMDHEEANGNSIFDF